MKFTDVVKNYWHNVMVYIAILVCTINTVLLIIDLISHKVYWTLSLSTYAIAIVGAIMAMYIEKYFDELDSK